MPEPRDAVSSTVTRSPSQAAPPSPADRLWTTSTVDAIAGPIGIIGALPEEIAGLIARLSASVGEDPDAGGAPTDPGITAGRHDARQQTVQTFGGRQFHVGNVDGVDCVAVLSRIGKVAAATTASILIHRFGVRAIVFVGVAGGVAEGVRVGDIVIGERFVQHDMDASPLFPRFEIPLSGKTFFAADAHWVRRLHDAATTYVAARGATPGDADVPLAHRLTPKVHVGTIASGDRFVSGAAERTQLTDTLPTLLAVDMESAAVAQVCNEHDVPFAAIRSISDSADDGAAVDFPVFLREVAAVYADGVLNALFARQASGAFTRT